MGACDVCNPLRALPNNLLYPGYQKREVAEPSLPTGSLPPRLYLVTLSQPLVLVFFNGVYVLERTLHHSAASVRQSTAGICLQTFKLAAVNICTRGKSWLTAALWNCSGNERLQAVSPGPTLARTKKNLRLRFYPSLFCFCWARSLFPEGLLTDGCDSEATEVQNEFASVKTARLRDTERDPRPKAECKACGKSVTSDRETWSGGGLLWGCTWTGLLGSTRGSSQLKDPVLFFGDLTEQFWHSDWIR